MISDTQSRLFQNRMAILRKVWHELCSARRGSSDALQIIVWLCTPHIPFQDHVLRTSPASMIRAFPARQDDEFKSFATQSLFCSFAASIDISRCFRKVILLTSLSIRSQMYPYSTGYRELPLGNRANILIRWFQSFSNAWHGKLCAAFSVIEYMCTCSRQARRVWDGFPLYLISAGRHTSPVSSLRRSHDIRRIFFCRRSFTRFRFSLSRMRLIMRPLSLARILPLAWCRRVSRRLKLEWRKPITTTLLTYTRLPREYSWLLSDISLPA